MKEFIKDTWVLALALIIGGAIVFHNAQKIENGEASVEESIAQFEEHHLESHDLDDDDHEDSHTYADEDPMEDDVIGLKQPGKLRQFISHLLYHNDDEDNQIDRILADTSSTNRVLYSNEVMPPQAVTTQAAKPAPTHAQQHVAPETHTKPVVITSPPVTPEYALAPEATIQPSEETSSIESQLIPTPVTFFVPEGEEM